MREVAWGQVYEKGLVYWRRARWDLAVWSLFAVLNAFWCFYFCLFSCSRTMGGSLQSNKSSIFLLISIASVSVVQMLQYWKMMVVSRRRIGIPALAFLLLWSELRTSCLLYPVCSWYSCNFTVTLLCSLLLQLNLCRRRGLTVIHPEFFQIWRNHVLVEHSVQARCQNKVIWRKKSQILWWRLLTRCLLLRQRPRQSTPLAVVSWWRTRTCTSFWVAAEVILLVQYRLNTRDDALHVYRSIPNVVIQSIFAYWIFCFVFVSVKLLIPHCGETSTSPLEHWVDQRSSGSFWRNLATRLLHCCATFSCSWLWFSSSGQMSPLFCTGWFPLTSSYSTVNMLLAMYL